ncbi:hypothetical protein AX15_005391 [Amanita polypyramis BW_CC]|nr:hypothetical protein AX15_005391 [Amanita polypyramis BW_CC]
MAANKNKVIPVISIAPQSLASLAVSLSQTTPVTPRQVLHRIRAFCTKVLGFAHVFDTTFARHISLKEHIREFEERRVGDAQGGANLPMLASACPGWICYAEKAHPEMLPYIAKTKSPQQVMGTLVKQWLGERWGKKPNEIYHVTVMPCYDKKLEASRKDFYNEVYSTRDVDCVITTGEMEILIRDKGWDLSAAVEGEADENGTFPELLQHPGSSSGSYLQNIMNYVLQTWLVPVEVSVKTVRNADYEEHMVREVEGGKVVFKGARCYGFKNLQNVVRKVGKERGVQVGSGAAGKLAVRRTRKLVGEGDKGYDYVEVMACPGGCVNGGGQLRPQDRDWGENGVRWGDREWTKKVEESYWRDTRDGHELPTRPAEGLAAEILEQGLELRTEYRAVESDVVGLAVKW